MSRPEVEEWVRKMHEAVCCPCDPNGCTMDTVPEWRYAEALAPLIERERQAAREEAEVRWMRIAVLRDGQAIQEAQEAAKAEALREAADALDEYADPFPGEEAAWLRDRANQIARTTDPEERP